MEDKEKLEEILQLNEKYVANNFNGIKVNGDNFKFIDGNLPILLSAPHAVRQNRNGEVKSADMFTGPIVELLCKTTGASGIVRTFNLNDDPNFENSGYSLAYKKAILDYIKRRKIAIIFDIHGCSDNDDFDIDIGTNNGININKTENFLNIINSGLEKVGRATVDKKFKASNEKTVSNYIHRKSNIPCFQIELSASIRKNPDRLLVLLNEFGSIISELSQKIEQGKNQEYELEI